MTTKTTVRCYVNRLPVVEEDGYYTWPREVEVEIMPEIMYERKVGEETSVSFKVRWDKGTTQLVIDGARFFGLFPRYKNVRTPLYDEIFLPEDRITIEETTLYACS